MPSKNPANLFKNLTCAAIGLLVLFTTSIFVIKGSYQANINSLVDQATLLKDSKYPAWGQFPGNVDANYNHLLTFYDIAQDNTATPLPPLSLDYSYQYSSMSFGQGNQGTIKYLNQWERKLSAGQEQMSNKQIRTINLAVQKAYNYEYFATDSRRFVLNFKAMWEAARDMLPTFYALYLNQFYLHDIALVTKTIFEVIGIDPTVQEQIVNHQEYGWKTPQNLAAWFRLVHAPNDQRTSLPAFELIQEAVGVTTQELLELVDEKSTLFKLSMALNGTIKSKLEAKTLNYDTCIPFCTDDQLIAVQFATGMLTNSPLMGSINLNKPFHLFNTSYSSAVQYNTFCSSQFDFTCIDPKNSIDFFENQGFSNFTMMSKVLTYRDNFQMVETLFDVINPMQDGDYGRSIIGYLNYLNTFNFNSFDQEKQEVNLESYKYIFPNYQFMIKNVLYMKDIMQSELIAIALIAQVERNNIQCEDFFISNIFSGFKKLCTQKTTDLSKLEGMRTFVQAYFFQNRQEFLHLTGMSPQIASQFLRLNTGDSLFADTINSIRMGLAKSFECQGTVCSPIELIAREWGGDRPILDNLPIKYFSTGKMSLFDLDYKRQFNGVDPRFSSVIGEKISLDFCLPLFGEGKESILILLNLVNYKLKAEKGDEFASKLVRYVQKSVLDSYFKSYFQVRTIDQLLSGFKSPYIQQKRKQEPNRGGAPWLASQLSFIDMKSKPERFSKINTGIYQKDKLRNIAQINGQSKGSSDYIVFAAGFEDVHETLLSQKQVFGTNMLGFHQNIQSDDSLTVYLDFISFGTILENTDSQFLYKNNITSYKYKLKDIGGKINIGIEEQNERYVIVDPSSYFVVEPQTGLTLEINVKYSVYTSISSMVLYNGQSNEYKLYDMEVVYTRQNINSIVEINNKKFELFVLQMITIGLAAFSILLTIIFSITYLRKRRNRKVDVMQTLISDFPPNTVLLQS